MEGLRWTGSKRKKKIRGKSKVKLWNGRMTSALRLEDSGSTREPSWIERSVSKYAEHKRKVEMAEELRESSLIPKGSETPFKY